MQSSLTSDKNHSSSTSRTDIRGLLTFLTIALVFGLVVNVVGVIWLIRIRRAKGGKRKVVEGVRPASAFV